MKILKSKIFQIILIAIIFTSIGVIAENAINASQITYTNTNNQETTVDAALNDLYTQMNGKNCVYGEFTCNSECYTGSGKLMQENFNAKKIMLWSHEFGANHNIAIALIYNENYSTTKNKLFATDNSNGNRETSNKFPVDQNNNLYFLDSNQTAWLNAKIYYYACK